MRGVWGRFVEGVVGMFIVGHTVMLRGTQGYVKRDMGRGGWRCVERGMGMIC